MVQRLDAPVELFVNECGEKTIIVVQKPGVEGQDGMAMGDCAGLDADVVCECPVRDRVCPKNSSQLLLGQRFAW